MKQYVFITGVAGSGKSTVSKVLRARGYAAYDIEQIDGLFAMYNTQTGERIIAHDNDSIEGVQQASWNCDLEKLQELMAREEHDISFYCGTATNWQQLLPLFTKTILLVVSEDVTRERLTTRTTGEFGRTAEVQDWVLSWKAWWEREMEQAGAEVVCTDQPLEQVVAEILSRSEFPEGREARREQFGEHNSPLS
ncbi:MAG: AAA family ATPase [Patescibacteria group bacterium]|jgi:broad-specificity NMP kinase